NDVGQEVKGGGRVVKNVAGYDLPKLLIGTLGTLGILTQVTLKLRPRPEEQALVTLGCDRGVLDVLLDRVYATRTRPVCLQVLTAAAARVVNRHAGNLLPDAPWVVILGFEENQEAVTWQVQQLLKEVPPALAQGLDARVGMAAEPLWQVL